MYLAIQGELDPILNTTVEDINDHGEGVRGISYQGSEPMVPVVAES